MSIFFGSRAQVERGLVADGLPVREPLSLLETNRLTSTANAEKTPRARNLEMLKEVQSLVRTQVHLKGPSRASIFSSGRASSRCMFVPEESIKETRSVLNNRSKKEDRKKDSFVASSISSSLLRTKYAFACRQARPLLSEINLRPEFDVPRCEHGKGACLLDHSVVAML